MPGRDILRLRGTQDDADASAYQGTPQIFAANGTVDPNGGVVVITNAGATTLTIPAPVAGVDDFKALDIFCTTAFAHILSFGANKLNGNKTSLTWTKAVAGYIGRMMAYQGVWYFESGIADAAAFAQQVTLA